MHVIIGAGPIGTATAEHLLAEGHAVRMVTRSGSGPTGVERIATDGTDVERLTELARGAEALYNCANPPYQRIWTRRTRSPSPATSAARWPPTRGRTAGPGTCRARRR